MDKKKYKYNGHAPIWLELIQVSIDFSCLNRKGSVKI